MSWRRLLVIISLSLAVAVSAKAETHEEEVDRARQLLRKQLLPYEKKGSDAVEAFVLQEIGFLRDIWLGDGAEEYYTGLIDRLEECATLKSLPVLERFLKKTVAIKKANKYQLPWDVFATVDRRVQRLWFKLKTMGWSPDQKFELLYGTPEHPPLIPLDEEVADNLLVEIGRPVRPALYKFLETTLSNDKRKPALGRVCLDEVFAPTEDEVDRFLTKPGTIGNEMILEYLRDCGDTRALAPLLEMVKIPSQAGFALQELRFWKEERDKIIPALIEVAAKERVVFNAHWPDIVDDGRGYLFFVLYTMGKDPRSILLFKSHLEKASKPEGWGDESVPAAKLRERIRAIRTAYRALREWGEWPEAKSPDPQ